MKTIIKSYFGSHLYGTSTPESDIDYKEIFIPHPEDIIMCRALDHTNINTNNSASKNTKDDVDHELYSLKYFIKLASQGETVALDMLHTPKALIVKSDRPEVWDYLYQNRARFYTTDMTAYLGYVRKQAAKYGVKGSRLAELRRVLEVIKDIPEWKHEDKPKDKAHNQRWKVSEIKDKLPLSEFLFWQTFVDNKCGEQLFYHVLGRKYQSTITVAEMKYSLTKLEAEYGERARKAEANEGVDWKALSHALRGGLQLKEIYSTGDLKYPLGQADDILDVKLGKLPFVEVQQMLEDTVDEVEQLSVQAKKNGMPNKVDERFWDKFVYDVYSDEVKRYLKVN